MDNQLGVADVAIFASSCRTVKLLILYYSNSLHVQQATYYLSNH